MLNDPKRMGWIVIARDDSVESGGTGEYVGSRRVFYDRQRAVDWAKNVVSPSREPLVVEFDRGFEFYECVEEGELQ